MPLSHFQPEHYARQLQAKQQRLLAMLQPHGIDHCDVFASEPQHYRMRAEFRIWHEGDDCHYVMFRPEAPATPVRIDRFPVACETIDRLMPQLLPALRSNALLKTRLYAVEFLASSQGACLVTLIYHKPIDDAWATAAATLAAQFGIGIVGRSRGRRLVIGQDWVDECLHINGRDWHWRQPEGAFTQPNAGTNRQMLGWACDMAGGIGGDLLELYCGIGNFTLPLSTQFRQVLATEVNKAACRAAAHNLARNGVHNVAMARLSSEEITQALQGVRPFRRLAAIDLAAYDFHCLLVDPPRAGLDPATRSLACGFPHILYVSCNPDTLLRDATALAATHRIRQAALFDQFPYTHHMECGLWLEQRHG